MHVCAMAMHAMLLLLTFVALYSLLRQAGSEPFAALVALMISLYPELIEGVTRIGDTEATLLTLLWIVLAIGKLRRAPGVGWAVMSGLAIAFGTLVRPNLALMPLLLAWALLGTAWRRALQLVATSLATMVAAYCLVTMAIHGRPFLPQNGDYNLYAGANSYTEQALLGSYNGEDSILMDMAAHGRPVTLNWLQPANRPGVADIRDAIYQPYYRQMSHTFIREHPGMMLKLAALKLATFLRPDTKRYHFFDAHKSAGVMAWLAGRTLEAIEVPAWILLLAWSRLRQWRGESMLVALMTAIYVLPFLLVNSDPRFRTALDVVLLAEMARMLYQRRCQLRQPVVCGVS